MSKATTGARILLGLVFFVFGLNGFLGFMPQPPQPPEAGAFLGALAATGYMFPLIKGTEVLAGALLLGNAFVPLALLLLAPVVVNIAAFHLLLAPGGAAMAVALVALLGFLAWRYRGAWRGVLARDARPEPVTAAGRPATA
ncbi:MAG: DoxX family protein [Myxococcales bacterium]|nr:DoxX family protein [Myxococcales bacterium]